MVGEHQTGIAEAASANEAASAVKLAGFKLEI